MTDSVDLDRLIEISENAPLLRYQQAILPVKIGSGLRIGIARDTAFGFYYPDDLEAMQAVGAELVFFDTIHDSRLPDVDGLFIGGGFPETSMAALEANTDMRGEILHAIAKGMPAYAECGGLMYLCDSLHWNGETRKMVGVIHGDAVMCKRPQGRGHTRIGSLPDCPWPDAKPFKAHEFHYAKVDNLGPDTRFAFEVLRGDGIRDARDGVVVNNLLAGFCHQRNTKANPWVTRFLTHVRANSIRVR